MPQRLPTEVDLLAMAEKQGETFATVREIKHAVNNMAQKVEAMISVAEQVRQLAVDRDDHEKRLAVLEADRHRREGAIGLVEWVSRHWPFTVLMATLAFLWAVVEGKLK
jgi:hypothetical protein